MTAQNSAKDSAKNSAQKKAQKQNTPEGAVLVRPGERAVLLSHHEYQLARALGTGLEDYDILMRRPDEDDAPGQQVDEQERWQPVRADKYLKHRAIGWREAESMEDLPEDYREDVGARVLFTTETNRTKPNGDSK